MSIKSFRTQILLLYIIFMFLNSVIPGFMFSSRNIWKYDKLIHFIEFFILGFLFINAIIDTDLNINKFLIGVFILTLIPTIDEGLQYLFDIPGRVPEFYDFVVDIIGEYSGAIFSVLIHKVKNKNG